MIVRARLVQSLLLCSTLALPVDGAAILMAGSTAPQFNESKVPATSHLWDGVGRLTLYDAAGKLVGTCSGELVAPRSVVTAAHCFFGGDGVAPGGVSPVASASFALLGTPGNPASRMSAFHIEPGYNANRGHGHRVDGHDLAIVDLATPIANAPIYPVNSGSIEDEIQRGFIVGFGAVGNGVDGHAADVRRQAVNHVDWVQTAEDMLDVRALGTAARGGRDCAARKCTFTPPADTLLLDFDNLDGENWTDMWDPDHTAGSFAVSAILQGRQLREGSPAAGDSGGGLFEFLADDTLFEHPILVGVTSSSSQASPTFGSLSYYTRLASFTDFVDTWIEAPEPGTGLLVSAALAAALLVVHRRTFPSLR